MAKTLISSHTASGTPAVINITSGIDNTYPVYEFYFVNMHPEDNSVWFGFQVNASDDEGGGFDTSPITASVFRAYVSESGGSGNLEYRTGTDQGQGTAYQMLTESTGNPNDGSASGVLTLYDPSSTTYVKHFIATSNDMYNDTSVSTFYIGGYINTGDPADQPAITEISFKFETGDIDAGTIYMYGVS